MKGVSRKCVGSQLVPLAPTPSVSKSSGAFKIYKNRTNLTLFIALGEYTKRALVSLQHE